MLDVYVPILHNAYKIVADEFLKLFFIFFETVSHSPSWPRIHCVAKDDLELMLLLPLSPKSWCHRHCALPANILLN